MGIVKTSTPEGTIHDFSGTAKSNQPFSARDNQEATTDIEKILKTLQFNGVGAYTFIINGNDQYFVTAGGIQSKTVIEVIASTQGPFIFKGSNWNDYFEFNKSFNQFIGSLGNDAYVGNGTGTIHYGQLMGPVMADLSKRVAYKSNDSEWKFRTAFSSDAYGADVKFNNSHPITRAFKGFSINEGEWTSQDTFPRKVGDINGDGIADVVGFGNNETVTMLGSRDGTFKVIRSVGLSFSKANGYSSYDKYPRELADVDGKNGLDIVGFGPNGVEVALSNGDGSFSDAKLVWPSAYSEKSLWSSNKDLPRRLADVNGDGRADIIGFADDHISFALGNTDGTFTAVPEWVRNIPFTKNAFSDQSQEKNLREVADVNGDKISDLIAFTDDGVKVALGKRSGNGGLEFSAPLAALAGYHSADGWTSNDKTPRMVADINGDGRADIVGFSSNHFSWALGQADGTFKHDRLIFGDHFSEKGGWASNGSTPRMLADMNGDGRADIVGFGSDGVYIGFASPFGGFRSTPVDADYLVGMQNLNLTGSKFANTLIGDDKANELTGGDGNDTISGLAGDDLIQPNNGVNVIYTGGGANTIKYGSGTRAFNDRINFETVTEKFLQTNNIVLLDASFASSKFVIQSNFDDLVFRHLNGSSLRLVGFLNSAHKSAPVTGFEIAKTTGAGISSEKLATVDFLSHQLSSVPFETLVSSFDSVIGSGAGAYDLMLAILKVATDQFKLGYLHSGSFDTQVIEGYLSSKSSEEKNVQFAEGFLERLRTGKFTYDDVEVYTIMRLLRSDNHDPALNNLAKKAFFAGYQASVAAVATDFTFSLEAIKNYSPQAIEQSPVIDAVLKVLGVNAETIQLMHTLLETGDTRYAGHDISLRYVKPAELPMGANGALVTDNATGHRYILVSPMLTRSWQGVVIAEELASLLSQSFELKNQTELPGDEGRYALTKAVRDIVHEVNSNGSKAQELRPAYDALPDTWKKLTDAQLDQLISRSLISNDKRVYTVGAAGYDYELAGFGDWTAPIVGAIAGVVTGAALGAVGLFVAGPAGVALGAKAGLETGLAITGLITAGAVVGGVAGQAIASQHEAENVVNAIENKLSDHSDKKPVDLEGLEEIFRSGEFHAPQTFGGFISLAEMGLSYEKITQMTGLEGKLSIARDFGLIPNVSYDNDYYTNVHNINGFESFKAGVESNQIFKIIARINALFPSELATEIADEIINQGNSRGMFGAMLEGAGVEGIDLTLKLYKNIRDAYINAPIDDKLKGIETLSWKEFWKAQAMTESSGDDIAEKTVRGLDGTYTTNGAYKEAQGQLADYSLRKLFSLFEKPGLFSQLDPKIFADALTYLTQTTMMSQAADLEMLRMAKKLLNAPTELDLAEAMNTFFNGAAASIKTIEDRGFGLLMSSYEEMMRKGTVPEEFASIAPQVMAVTKTLQDGYVKPIQQMASSMGDASAAGFGNAGPIPLASVADIKKMVFPNAPLAKDWKLDGNLKGYLDGHHAFINEISSNNSSGRTSDILNAANIQALLKNGTVSDGGHRFVVDLRLVSPDVITGALGITSVRVGDDGLQHIEILIRNDLSVADANGVLFEELSNVDEHVHRVLNETDPIGNPLIDAVTVGDYGGRELIEYELYLRDGATSNGLGLPMFTHLSKAALGHSFLAETMVDDMWVTQNDLGGGKSERVTFYANSNKAMSFTDGNNTYIPIETDKSATVHVARPAVYLSTHSGYGSATEPAISTLKIKSITDLSRARFQFNLDIANQETSFTIVMEDLAAFSLNYWGATADHFAFMPWQLTNFNLANITNPKKSSTMTYLSGLAHGLSRRDGTIGATDVGMLREQLNEQTRELNNARADNNAGRVRDIQSKIVGLQDAINGFENDAVQLNAGSRLGGYLFSLRDHTRAMHSGVDEFDTHALVTAGVGTSTTFVSGVYKLIGELSTHNQNVLALAVKAVVGRCIVQVFTTAMNEYTYSTDAELFQKEIGETGALTIAPDSEYATLVKNGATAGSATMSAAHLWGLGVQVFGGLQFKSKEKMPLVNNNEAMHNALHELPEASASAFVRAAEGVIDGADRPVVAAVQAARAEPYLNFNPSFSELNVGFFYNFARRSDSGTYGMTKQEANAALLSGNEFGLENFHHANLTRPVNQDAVFPV